MKTLVTLAALLFSMSAMAFSEEGHIKNVVEDDEGIKVILTPILEKSGKSEIQTIYIQNSQTDFDSVKQTLMMAKIEGQKVVISKTSLQNFKVMRAGK